MKKEINEVKYKWEINPWDVIDTHRNEIKVIKTYTTYQKAKIAADKLNLQHESDNAGPMGSEGNLVIPRYGVQLSVVKESTIDTVISKITEALSIGARLRAKASMKRRAPMLMKERAISLKKSANKSTVERRAAKSAHNIIMNKKVLHGRDKNLMSPSEKQAVEKRMQAFEPAVQKLAKKMFSKVKKAGETRRQSALKAK